MPSWSFLNTTLTRDKKHFRKAPTITNIFATPFQKPAKGLFGGGAVSEEWIMGGVEKVGDPLRLTISKNLPLTVF